MHRHHRRLLFLFAQVLWACVTATAEDINLAGGDTLRIEAVSPQTFRIRTLLDGKPIQGLLERYGILGTEAATTKLEVTREGGKIILRTTAASLAITTADGAMTLRDANGRLLVEGLVPLPSKLPEKEIAPYRQRQEALARMFSYGSEGEAKKSSAIVGDIETRKSDSGSIERIPTQEWDHRFGLSFSLAPEERFYGLGAASAKHLQLRGGAYRNFPEYRGAGGFNGSKAVWEQTEQPNPSFLSSRGWGMVINTSWIHYVDLGKLQKDRGFVWGPGGDLDVYLIAARDMPGVIDQQTRLTGRPIVLPLWGYGLMDVTNTGMNQFEVLGEAERFRKEGIPCDMIALEPGWMEKHYDFSPTKDWNKTRFQTSWQPREWNWQGALQRMGYKLFLWLCCDDDLTITEERRLATKEGRSDDFAGKAEPWFNHLQRFIKMGVSGFKIDPARLVEPHHGKTYANGKSYLEVHNLMQSLLHKQMWEGFTAKDGNASIRRMHHYCGGYLGIQRWGATTAGDNGKAKGLCWTLAQGFSGHMNATFDLFPYEVEGEREGTAIHTNFLMPWVELTNWATALQPWYLGENRFQMFKEYARLRYRLLPYLYSLAHEGARTGMPIARAMPLAFPDDRACDDLTSEWMLGPFLLAAGYTDEVYLPAGGWIDHWTGERIQGPLRFKPTVPANRGGPLFIREGAILPTGPEVAFADQKTWRTLGLDIWPGSESKFTLSEDDFTTYQYLDGAMATTELTVQTKQGGTKISIGRRSGSFIGMSKSREFRLRVHGPRPGSVEIQGKSVVFGENGWQYDTAGSVVTLSVSPTADAEGPIIVELRN